VKGDTGGIQDSKYPGNAQFITQGKAKYIKTIQGYPRIQAVEGYALFPKQGFKVRSRGKGPIAGDAPYPVQPVVEDLQSRIGHTNLIKIGKGDQHPQQGPFPSRVIPDNPAILSPYITGRLLDIQ
jgi:hypothetical protein